MATGKRNDPNAVNEESKPGVNLHNIVGNMVVGTAGHVDHGKTTLIKALTGIDADRLAEEKRRGITIDLGFAHLQLTPDLRIGFVDVPGHERFVRNMLAGVGGMDLVMLVIAADESIKPQTREHFDICRLLGIAQGIVVITKSDSVDDELLDLVRLEVEEFVAGSFLERAPVIAVSAVTGAGLEELRRCLEQAGRLVAARDIARPARLSIDRAFSIRGFGTVVTGTLLSGAVTRESELELLPSRRTLRIRGIQTYGHAADRSEAGTRTALNIPDIEHREIQRGMVLAEPDRFETTRVVDCRVELLASAPALRNRAPVHFHSGTAEIEGRVRLFGKEKLEPGASCFARLRLREPAVLAPGDRFILRRFSPVVTIGGGAVIDLRPPRERRLARIEARLRILSADDAVAKVALLVEESAFGLGASDLARRLGVNPEQALADARQAKVTVLDPPGWVVARAWVQSTRAAILKLLQAHHSAAPLAPGMAKSELKAHLPADLPPFLFDALLAGMPELALEADHVRHRAHQVTMNADEERARQHIASAFEHAGLAVPPVAEVIAQTGLDAARSQTLLRMLLKDRTLIRVSDDLVFHGAAIVRLKQLLSARKSESFTVSTFKDWTGISRKYAVPLLEFLDREKVTLRKGDVRVVI